MAIENNRENVTAIIDRNPYIFKNDYTGLMNEGILVLSDLHTLSLTPELPGKTLKDILENKPDKLIDTFLKRLEKRYPGCGKNDENDGNNNYTDPERDIIQKNYALIVQNLSCDYMIDHFVEEDILSFGDVDHLNKYVNDPIEKSKSLLDKILFKMNQDKMEISKNSDTSEGTKTFIKFKELFKGDKDENINIYEAVFNEEFQGLIDEVIDKFPTSRYRAVCALWENGKDVQKVIEHLEEQDKNLKEKEDFVSIPKATKERKEPITKDLEEQEKESCIWRICNTAGVEKEKAKEAYTTCGNDEDKAIKYLQVVLVMERTNLSEEMAIQEMELLNYDVDGVIKKVKAEQSKHSKREAAGGMASNEPFVLDKADESDETIAIQESKISFVMSQAGVERDDAIVALTQSDHDTTNAVQFIDMERIQRSSREEVMKTTGVSEDKANSALDDCGHNVQNAIKLLKTKEVMEKTGYSKEIAIQELEYFKNDVKKVIEAAEKKKKAAIEHIEKQTKMSRLEAIKELEKYNYDVDDVIKEFQKNQRKK